MLLLNVYYKMKPDSKEIFLRKLDEEKIRESTMNENGNLKYDFYPSFKSDEIILVEKWESEACLDSHRNQPHFQKLVALKNEYVVKTIIESYEK